jgi:hypothetical protein
MSRSIFLFGALCLFKLFVAAAPVFSQEVLRGEISGELEPVYAVFLGLPSPPDNATAALWALEDSAAVFAGMIYGWAFEYEPGERARNIPENIELRPLGTIQSGDERLKVSDARVKGDMLYMWSDYELSSEQAYRVAAWNSQNTIGVNGTGYAPLQGKPGVTERKDIKFSALEEAASRSVRSYLRTQVKNRPRIIKGYIALSRFPLYRIVEGKWAATARFRLQVTEVVPFSVY